MLKYSHLLHGVAVQKTLLDESLSMYLQAVVNDMKQTAAMPTLFPPSELQLEELNNLVRLATALLDF